MSREQEESSQQSVPARPDRSPTAGQNAENENVVVQKGREKKREMGNRSDRRGNLKNCWSKSPHTLDKGGALRL